MISDNEIKIKRRQFFLFFSILNLSSGNLVKSVFTAHIHIHFLIRKLIQRLTSEIINYDNSDPNILSINLLTTKKKIFCKITYKRLYTFVNVLHIKCLRKNKNK